MMPRTAKLYEKINTLQSRIDVPSEDFMAQNNEPIIEVIIPAPVNASAAVLFSFLFNDMNATKNNDIMTITMKTPPVISLLYLIISGGVNRADLLNGAFVA